MDADASNNAAIEGTGVPDISFNALSGEYSPRTLRLKGTYQGHTFNILVDNGSSFNFIKPAVARRLRVHVTNIEPFKVFVGSDDFIWCNTCSYDVPILVQGISFPVDLHHLEISGADMVFSLSWLQSLGQVLTDYNRLTMEFDYHGTPIILHVEHLLSPNPIKNCRINHMLLHDDISSLCTMQVCQPDKPTANFPLVVQELLKKYVAVFQEPKGLPPTRDISHRIPLYSNSKSI